jgi:hypothetical protein
LYTHQIIISGLTEERQEAEGRKYNFCPLPKGFKAPKFIETMGSKTTPFKAKSFWSLA